MFVIKPLFFLEYAIGDWVAINAQVICSLYKAAGTDLTSKDEILLRKPRIIGMMSITEVVMLDFLMRAGEERYPFHYIHSDDRKEFKKYNEGTPFSCVIDKFKDYGFIGTDSSHYARLNDLRIIRNLVHIAKEPEAYKREKKAAFSYDKLIDSEKITEFVLKYLEKNFPRQEYYYKYMKKDIELPWKGHYSDEEIPDYKPQKRSPFRSLKELGFIDEKEEEE